MAHDGDEAAFDAKLKRYLEDGVAQDWVDNRDRFYIAPLSILPGALPPTERVFPDGPWGPSRIGVRDQGQSGRCVGYALANLIDIQRRVQMPEFGADEAAEHAGGRLGLVSADMLYHMARFHDRYTQRDDGRLGVTRTTASTEGVRTLRSVIKGFYHHGACLDHPGELDDLPPECWRSRCYEPHPAGPEADMLTVAQAKAARALNLGAYYRLRPVLNDYHTALKEAGAILVSACITSDWLRVDDEGRIPWSETTFADRGVHAFVIVGYCAEGFYVLNSWGSQFGKQIDDEGQRCGVGVWQYGDWSRNVVDAWVLRLGVSAPDAFDLNIGEHGVNRSYEPVRAGSAPCHELLGHYLHLDDGRYVELSAYPSDEQITKKTLDLLGEKAEQRGTEAEPSEAPHLGVVLWFPGGLETLQTGFSLAVARKKWLKSLGLYPITVFWCNDFNEHALQVLAEVFRDCEEKAGRGAAHLDALIEERAHGLGRAFWRDIERAADRSIGGFGDNVKPPVLQLAERAMRHALDHGCQLHIVAEGAGALLLYQLLITFKRTGQLGMFTRATSSAALSMPALPLGRPRPGAREAAAAEGRPLRHDEVELDDRTELVLSFLGQLNNAAAPYCIARLALADAAGQLPGPRRATLIQERPRRPPGRIFLPDSELEKRIHVGAYGKSVLHLVANSFLSQVGTRTPPPPPVLLGMSEASSILAGHPGSSCMIPITLPENAPLARGPIDQLTLSLHPDLEAGLLVDIREHAMPRSKRGPG